MLVLRLLARQCRTLQPISTCSISSSYSATQLNSRTICTEDRQALVVRKMSTTSHHTGDETEPDARKVVTFLEHIGKLKHLKRTGWVIRGVRDCETVASHMYRMAMMTYLLDERSARNAAGQPLDRAKCLELALVHDMAESIVGDLTPYCGVSKAEKMQRELDAMLEITRPLGEQGIRLMTLFTEYEQAETAEARFVKELDRLDMVLQAHEYEKRDDCPGQLQEFFDSTAGMFSHPLIVSVVEQIKADRRQSKSAGVVQQSAATPSAPSEPSN